MTKKRPFKVKWKRLVWITVTTRKRRGDILQHLISLVHHLPPSCLSLLLHFDFTLFANLPTHVVQESRRVGWRMRHSSWNGCCAQISTRVSQTPKQQGKKWHSGPQTFFEAEKRNEPFLEAGWNYHQHPVTMGNYWAGLLQEYSFVEQ